MGKITDVPLVLYGGSMWAIYFEQDWWASSEAKNPQTLTGTTAQMADMEGAPSLWIAKRNGVPAKLRALNRRMWARLNNTRYADAVAIVRKLESECGDLIEGYVLRDEPTTSHIAMLREQQAAIRENSTKPGWLNFTATNRSSWPAILDGIGSSDLRAWPEIITVDAYPRSYTDTATAHPFHNQWRTGVSELPWDTGGEVGVDYYVTALVHAYMTASRRHGVRLSPVNGHVLGVIGQGYQQYPYYRLDRNTPEFQAWIEWTNAQAVEMQKYMLGRPPFDVAKSYGMQAGYTFTDYPPTKIVDGISLLQFRSLYVSLHSGHNGNGTEAQWLAVTTRTGMDAEMGILQCATRSPDTFRLAPVTKHGKTTADGWADITGDVIYPAGAPEPALTGQCFPPRITPFGVFYDTASVTVTMACDTAGVTIRYTLDGSTPTGASTLYTAPIAVNASTMIRAIAQKGGLTDSPVATRRLQLIADAAPGPNLTHVKWFTPTGLGARLNGAKFQGSNDMTGWVDIHTIVGAPANGYSTVAVTPTVRYRYFRLTNSGAAVAVADLQWLYDGEEQLGAAITSGCVTGKGLDLAYDGSTVTYAEVTAAGGWIGLDVGVYSGPRKPALSPAALIVALGSTETARVLNLGSRTVTSRVVANTTVCQITASTADSYTVTGLVVGRTTITVTLSDGTSVVQDVDVQVGDPQPTPIITPATVTVQVGGSVDAVLTQLGTRTVASVATSNAGVATVERTGVTVRIAGVAAGSATITVTLSDSTALTVAATVSAAPPAVLPSLSPAALQLSRGESAAVVLVNLGALTWTVAVANSAVATVARSTSGNGFVVTGAAAGATVVTVSLSNATTLALPVGVSAPPPPPSDGRGMWLSVPK